MKSKHRSPSSFRRTAAMISLSLFTTTAYGDAVFDFPNSHPLVGEGIDDGTNGRMTVVDSATVPPTPVTLSTVEVVGQNGSLASDGVELNVLGSGNNALGVESITNDNANPDNDRDFDPGEQWVFKFDVDVELVNFRLSGWTDAGNNGGDAALDSAFTISFSDATPDIVLTGNFPSNIFVLPNTPVTAGVEITLSVVSDGSRDDMVRLQEFTLAAIPPPPTGDNLIWAGADGDDWNTVDANFSGDDTVFAAGDNVEIQTAGAINVDVGGITAGSLTDTTPAGTVTLQTGNLTGTSFVKSGASTLLLASPITLDSTIATNLAGGTLQVANGATLSTDSLVLSGSSTLQLDSGAALTVGGGITLGAGGVTIDTVDALSLDDIANNSLEEDPTVPLTKQGSGILTLTGFLGIQNSGPVDLDILDGSVVATGANQINIRGENVWNGDVTLDIADLEFHGSTVTGTGSIIAQSGSASINSRFNRGNVSIDNGIILNSDLVVDAPTNNDNGSELYLNGVISGVANLEKGGNGLVVLSGNNTYAGTTTIDDNGTLAIGGGLGSTSGTLGAGDVSIIDADATLRFQRDDVIVVSNLISGLGGVTVDGGDSSSVELNGLNDYEGDTVLENGTLVATVIDVVGFESSIGLGSAPAESLQLRGGGLSYTGGDDVLTDRLFLLGGGGGTISADGAGTLSFDTGAAVGQGTGVTARTLTLGGTVSGINEMGLDIGDGPADGEGDFAAVSLTKTGSTTWCLIGSNTYTGDTTVDEGTLIVSAADFADSSGVIIGETGAFLQLDHAFIDTIASLDVGAGPLPDGRYGAVGSPDATDTEIPQITGTGYLEVVGIGSDYDTWAASFSLVGGPTDDDDLDGVSNEDEYAFGLDPTSSSSLNPISEQLDSASGDFAYTRRNITVYSTGLTYYYGYSTTLVGDFIAFTPDEELSDDGDPVEAVTATVPAALLSNDKLFIRISTDESDFVVAP
ncbi:autotransporter-associated beta strand repeat-containing protein [Haloferula sp.]|uniref:autotransporter-associated beta strand repeat-containing protein n=1 Tax=Haloferula sp. TaxID=2497595 RepID=UPI00329DD390